MIICTVLLNAFSAGDAGNEERKINYAVVNLRNGDGVTAGEADIIADRLRTELFRTGKANMMERDQMQEILKEQGFQASGACTDEACMVEIGQLLGVERLVSGSIGKLGSMFLLNLRTIDVQTAKIMKVVSVDIKGDIEDVVVELQNISNQLVGIETTQKTTVVEEDKEEIEEKEAVEEEEEEKKEVSKPKKDPGEPKTVVGGSEKKERNKNRGGMRLGFNLYPGAPEHEYFLRRDFYLIDFKDTIKLKSSNKLDDNRPPMHPQLIFTIKGGRFIGIDIGPGFMMAKDNYKGIDGYNQVHTLDYYYWMPSLTIGVNFVYRILPLKVNLGMFSDMSMPIVYWEKGVKGLDSTESDIRLTGSIGIGLRTGIELLPSPHVGFGFSLLIHPHNFSYEMDEISGTDTIYDPNTNTTYLFDFDATPVHKVRFPAVGLGLSMNFYF